MKQKEPADMTNEELSLELQKIKSTMIINAVLFGVMIGIATYSTIKNGFGILTFFPLFFIPMFIKKRNYKKVIENELKERNVNQN